MTTLGPWQAWPYRRGGAQCRRGPSTTPTLHRFPPCSALAMAANRRVPRPDVRRRSGQIGHASLLHRLVSCARIALAKEERRREVLIRPMCSRGRDARTTRVDGVDRT
jgi:hypothetical protein